MRRNRRNGHSGQEFGGSGEDSFVAVVVTKLTGALLFILLLTMVIMALLPKVADLPSSGQPGAENEAEAPPLAIVTPEQWPEAIAGHPYTLALAATGSKGATTWSVSGDLPDGLSLDPATGVIRGTPRAGTPKPAELVLRVSDGSAQDARPAKLVVYQSDLPLSTPVWWKPGIPPVPLRAWLQQGFGFLVLLLVHLVGMNAVSGLDRRAHAAPDARQGEADETVDDARRAAGRRFAAYRMTVRLASLTSAAVLAVWLVRHHP